jgi:hypothetical protein
VRPGLIHHFGWHDGYGYYGYGGESRRRICGDGARRRICGDERRIGFDERMRIVSALYIYYYIIIIIM